MAVIMATTERNQDLDSEIVVRVSLCSISWNPTTRLSLRLV
ncbi:hypothetical protein VD0004_g5455 [Verticillium dahliae]|nr:hypothetical protein VD0004_g5455 [Verticillium dahliae]